MILEQRLEENVIAAIGRSITEGVYFSGAWRQADAGDVKGEEPADDTVVCGVTVSPRAMQSYGDGSEYVEAEFSVRVSVAVPGERDATGAVILDAWSRIAPVIWRWCKTCDSETESEIGVPETDGEESFCPGGLMQTGGTPPTWNAGAKAWAFDVNFSIRGIIK